MEPTERLLSVPRAAAAMGADVEDVRAWANRKVDPLPSVVVGRRGNGKRVHRKIVMAEVDTWLSRQASKEGVR